MPSPALQSDLVRVAGDSTPSISFGTLPAAGRGVVVCIASWDNLAHTHSEPTDNQGGGAGSYTQASTTQQFSPGGADNVSVSVWVRHNLSAPSGTFTVTCSIGTATDSALVVIEYPLVTASSVDQADKATATSAGPTVTLATTTQGDDVVLGVVSYAGASTTMTPNGTNLPNQLEEEEDNASGQAIGVYDRDVEATGAYTANITLGASRVWGIVAAALKEAAVAAAASRPVFPRPPRVWRGRLVK